MSIPDDLQKFCVLEWSGCKQKKRTKELREFDCPKCQKKTTLVPRCTFQVDLSDGSGSKTAFISGDLAEKLIAMPAVHIFQTTYAKWQLLDIKHAQDMLGDKLFYVQLRKTAWMSANVTQSTLTILNYMEKECALSEKGNERNHKRPNALGQPALDMQGQTSDNQGDHNAGAIEPSNSA